jgi:hypothetical protein
MPFDFARELAQGQDSVDPSGRDSLAGHAEDDTCGLVLSEGASPCRMHLSHACRAIVAHSGQDDPKSVRACSLCRRPEEHVHRRSMPAHIGTFDDADPVLPGLAPQDQVMIARGNQSETRTGNVAVRRFSHLDAAEAVEPLRKGPGEMLGHMLNDDDRGGSGG